MFWCSVLMVEKITDQEESDQSLTNSISYYTPCMGRIVVLHTQWKRISLFSRTNQIQYMLADRHNHE